MKRKVLSALMAGTMAASLLAGCGSSSSTTSTSTAGTSAADATASASTETASAAGTSAAATGNGEAIHLVNGKIEIDTQLKAAAAAYQKETGQEVVIDSIGGGADIQGTLKSDYQSGSMPDMFVIGGEGDYKTWQGKCADLSDCAFVKDTDFAFKDGDTVVGFPYAIEGYGITYNADILEKAGIDPTTLTNASKLEDAFKTLDAKKSDLGLQAVCSVAAESGQMYWSTGNHIFGYYLSGGLEKGDNTYYDQLMQGKIDETRMGEFADFIGVLYKYSDPTVLTSGTYDDQLKLFAEGKAAFITQGDWIDPSLYGDSDTSYKVSFKSGMIPLAWTKADMPNILADCPSWWCVYKDGANVDACKAFLDWLATSEEGQKCLISDCDMVSPYKTTTESPTTPLAQSLKGYVDAGKTSSWAWSNMPSGIAQNYLGAVFESYAKDNDKAAFIKNIAQAISDCISQSE
jgi:raffinose/stachyose/melibiose transport system substrate-binding protein